MDYMQEYQNWLDHADAATVQELEAIRGDEEEIRDRFYRTLEFGTAGLRGVIGAGPNRMNTYVVGQATQGLANQLLRTNPKGTACSVAIAYDSRHKSDVFAREAAMILAANGIKAYLFRELKPVPELSFAVRYKKATAGIAVTASHNPAKYNGYKVYGADGAQLNPELADIVLEEINQTDMFTGIKRCDFEQAVQNGMIEWMGDEVEDAYLDCVQAQCINPELAKEKGHTLKFVYTPFHGAGNKPVRKILKRIGFDNVVVVKEQEKPDGDFPTVASPNPENKEGFTLAIGYARDCGADLIVGTDPDSDRVGILVRDQQGEYIPFTGNQVGALLTEYILSSLKERGQLPRDGYVVKTIVTTNIIQAICDYYGVEMKEVLTGFKFIGEKIKESEETGKGTYLFGFEESYGYLKGTYARDKDAVVATMLIAEMALYYQEKGSSLLEQLEKLYQKYGYYREQVESVTMEGIEGLDKIRAIMEAIRKNPPKSVAGKKVLAVRDYQTSIRTEVDTGKTEKILLPVSNVIYLELEDQNNFIIRPSGTEPKIKLYCLLKGRTPEEAEQLANLVRKDIKQMIG
ncbi:phospho-sugar mutase [Ructibacterium gallinarum]|uniref:Phosphoglucomutase n=1 Tax=Ructibacterium gallinarum TaxID=2779355 RepID=A0A9D5LY03_9FIRM|nr:phospho-sugar mutase [Ructibacterium gallinarum]MBE5038947.1 phospho-sugar mutase [Ructibacterium gallinarum]